MDPTTAYELAQYRIAELHAEASAQRLAAEARRNYDARSLGRLGTILAALRMLPARLLDVSRISATEPEVPCR